MKSVVPGIWCMSPPFSWWLCISLFTGSLTLCVPYNISTDQKMQMLSQQNWIQIIILKNPEAQKDIGHVKEMFEDQKCCVWETSCHTNSFVRALLLLDIPYGRQPSFYQTQHPPPYAPHLGCCPSSHHHLCTHFIPLNKGVFIPMLCHGQRLVPRMLDLLPSPAPLPPKHSL